MLSIDHLPRFELISLVLCILHVGENLQTYNVNANTNFKGPG